MVDDTAEYISDLGARSSNVKLVPAGTPIMSFKLTIGRTAVAARDLYTNEAIAAFFVDESKVDRRFIYHILPGSAGSVVTDVAIKGATLNKKSLATMPLVLPPLGEQRRIAEIFDTLDDQIGIMEKLASKTYALKSALVEELIGGDWPTQRYLEVLLNTSPRGSRGGRHTTPMRGPSLFELATLPESISICVSTQPCLSGRPWGRKEVAPGFSPEMFLSR
ncbi:MAG: restriction endonuclease subunit S [Kineosporiaceae bacterium]|nr:restriction endonuclease subunit S [Kineosporiaceae bacterium]